MPRGFKLVQSILRGLRSPTVKKIVEWGAEHISPRIGELLLSGTERLKGSGLGAIAEKITDKSLRGLAALPGTVEEIGEVLQDVELPKERDPRKEKERKREQRRLRQLRKERSDMPYNLEPYNLEPNATFPDPRVAYEAMATLGPRSAAIPGSGMLVYGNDQPYRKTRTPSTKVSGRSACDIEMGAPPHPINYYVEQPMSAQNTFGYIGWPGAASQLPNPQYSVAGQYFRPTGPGTNTGDAIPAYGIDDPQPRPRVPRREPKRKTRMAVEI